MQPKSWEEGIRTGLREIADLPTLEALDRYRLVVRWARWNQFLRSGGEAGTEPLAVPMPARVEILRQLEGFPLPDPGELLDDLERHLQSDEDAAGPLMDVLLDVDDLAGVRELIGESKAAHDLARMAAAAASLFPERLVDLSPWAFGRLETLPEDAAVAALWTVVAESPAQALAAQLPAPASKGLVDAVLGNLEKTGSFEKAGRVIPLRRPVHAARRFQWPALPVAASSTEDVGVLLHEPPLCVCEEQGRLVATVDASGIDARPCLKAVATDPATGRVLGELSFAFRQDAHEYHADLGPARGEESLAARLSGGLPKERVDVSLLLEWEPE